MELHPGPVTVPVACGESLAGCRLRRSSWRRSSRPEEIPVIQVLEQDPDRAPRAISPARDSTP